MAIIYSKCPTVSELVEPTFKVMADSGRPMTKDEILNAVIKELKLPASILSELHKGKSGVTELEYRLGWALTNLKKYGAIANASRGVWEISPAFSSVKSVDRDDVAAAISSTKKKASPKPKKSIDGLHGRDIDCRHVRYADDVPDDEKVPGLTACLEWEYEKIVEFARSPWLFHEDSGLSLVPVVLSNKKPLCNCYDISEEAVSRMKNRRRERNRNQDERRREETIDEQVDRQIGRNKGQVCFSVIGGYEHSGAPFDVHYNFKFPDDGAEPYIVIYYNNVSFKSFDDYKAQLIWALACEYFYFIYDRVPHIATGASLSRWETRSVEDSLADFFSVLYLVFSKNDNPCKINEARKRYTIWEKWFGAVPFAEALWYYHVIDWINFSSSFDVYIYRGHVIKFLEVFDVSRSSISDAYRILIS